MQFSAQTLLPYASGALAAWDTPAGICLRRLTPRQLQQFEGDHGMVIRSRCNAGIALEMRTDAQALEMDFSVQAEAPAPLWLYRSLCRWRAIRRGGIRRGNAAPGFPAARAAGRREGD